MDQKQKFNFKIKVPGPLEEFKILDNNYLEEV